MASLCLLPQIASPLADHFPSLRERWACCAVVLHSHCFLMTCTALLTYWGTTRLLIPSRVWMMSGGMGGTRVRVLFLFQRSSDVHAPINDA